MAVVCGLIVTLCEGREENLLASLCSHGLLATDVYGILMTQACALPTTDEIFIICSRLSDKVKAQPLLHPDMDCCLTAIYSGLLLLQTA